MDFNPIENGFLMSWLIVGLGNPGDRYRANRHNIGFLVADELSRRAGADYRSKFHGNHTKIRMADEDAHLLQPSTYMNRSGTSVRAAATFFKVGVERTVVVHDELDIPHGEVRVKVGGGHGGHNGLRSIFERSRSINITTRFCRDGTSRHFICLTRC